MFTTTEKIKARKDGTFVVISNGEPYHVVSKEIDPYNIYDLDEVADFAKKNKGLVVDDGPSIEEVRSECCRAIEAHKDQIMSEGFMFKGKMVRADSEAQANLTAWVVRDGRGGIDYPKNWILANGELLKIASTAELDAFADAFEDFKESVYTAIITAKAQIATATAEQAKAIFDNWESSIAR